jgi:desulfoferrodoxin (superoxide reductase-like protein)
MYSAAVTAILLLSCTATYAQPDDANAPADRRPHTHENEWSTLAEKLELHVPPPKQSGCYPYAADGSCHPEGWAGKAKSHAPSIVRVQSDVEGDRRFRVSVTHGVKPEHYVGVLYVKGFSETHKAGKVLKLAEFSGTHHEPPALEFSAPDGMGYDVVKAYAYCNLHGLWASVPFELRPGGMGNFQHLTGGPNRPVHAEL